MGTCTVVPQRGRVASFVPCVPGSAVASGLTAARAEDLLDWLEANGFPAAEVTLKDCARSVTVRYLPPA